MSARVCYGDFYLADGSTTGGSFYAHAVAGASRETWDLVHLAIGQAVIGAMGSNEVEHFYLDRKMACDLIVALADALVHLENRKGTK